MATADITSLISELAHKDPKLYQALMALQRRLETAEGELFPLVRQSQEVETVAATVTSPPSFTFVFTATTVRFNWSQVTGAAQYEIRKGADWDTATFQLRTTSLQADIDPLTVGAHTYLIKTISSTGTYSTAPTQCVVTVPALGGITISKSVIDNNVLLNWTTPTSVFRILHYEVSKDAVVVGTVDSTFFTRFENVAGVYTYRIVAVDVAGNRSPNSDIEVQVQTPPDYALTDQHTSTLGGTRTNVILQSGPKLLANWQSETFETHFTSRTWLTPKNQVDAGYPIYIQPAATTGSYEEVIDYGTVITNVIATISYNQNLLTPSESMNVVVKMAASDDDITYTPFVSGASQFISQMRYLKFRLEFTGSSDKALMEISNVVISLNVKRENDGGELTANASDVGGTTVTFNKDFKDVESITATTKTLEEPFYTVIDFNDVPNPTDFKVFVFDSTGNRVTKTIEWKARGIV